MVDKTLSLSLVIASTLGKSFFKATKTAQACAAVLGKTWDQTNKKLKATGALIKYKMVLKD